MHVPDHLIDPGPEVAAVGSALLATAAVRRRRTGPVPGLLPDGGGPAPLVATAALVFALQMVNFPVASGTSGHLLGGALAVALVGPRRACLALASVVGVQALVFADGGVGALGVNLWVIALVPVGVAAAASWLLDGPTAGRTRWAATAVGALAGPPVAAAALAALVAWSSPAGVAPSAIVGSMVGVHLAIGVGEAVLTVAIVALLGVVGRTRPAGILVATWSVAAVAATGLAAVASSAPDGLQRVGIDLGLAVDGPSVLGAPLAGYSPAGLGGAVGTLTAGLVGLAVCAAVATAIHHLSGGTPVARTA